MQYSLPFFCLLCKFEPEFFSIIYYKIIFNVCRGQVITRTNCLYTDQWLFNSIRFSFCNRDGWNKRISRDNRKIPETEHKKWPVHEPRSLMSGIHVDLYHDFGGFLLLNIWTRICGKIGFETTIIMVFWGFSCNWWFNNLISRHNNNWQPTITYMRKHYI